MYLLKDLVLYLKNVRIASIKLKNSSTWFSVPIAELLIEWNNELLLEIAHFAGNKLEAQTPKIIYEPVTMIGNHT